MIMLDFQSGTKTPTPSVVRYPTPIPSKNLRLPAPSKPTPQPCLQVISVPKVFLFKERLQRQRRESINTRNPTKILGKQF